MMAGIINGLWIGDSLGPMERLSITSFLRHGHPFQLYHYGPLSGVPEGTTLRDGNEILPAAEIFQYQTGPGKGSFAAFANLFRYKLLFERGGWWTDMDVVCVRPFAFAEPLVLAREHKRPGGTQLANSIIKLPAGHDLARLSFERGNVKDRQALEWGQIGPELLTSVADELGLSAQAHPPEVFCPIAWFDWEKALQRNTELDAVISPATCAVHLWHEMWRRAGVDRDVTPPPTSVYGRLLKRYGVTV